MANPLAVMIKGGVLGRKAARRGWRIAREAAGRALAAAGAPSDFLVRNDLLPRTSYAYGLYGASIQAKRLGLNALNVVELGVGAGGGMLALAYLCGLFSRDLGMKYQVIGFDTGKGLPPPKDYRDHPEVWEAADFVHNADELHRKLPEFASVMYGDVSETVPRYVASLTADAPLGYTVLDLDYYSSSKAALDLLFTGSPEKYLPAGMMYADDTEYMLTFNSWCGEAAAIRDFNAEHPMRKIEAKRVRPRAKPANWHHQMYGIHILDHPVRNDTTKAALGKEKELKSDMF